jgi:hypothetical protein
VVHSAFPRKSWVDVLVRGDGRQHERKPLASISNEQVQS